MDAVLGEFYLQLAVALDDEEGDADLLGQMLISGFVVKLQTGD